MFKQTNDVRDFHLKHGMYDGIGFDGPTKATVINERDADANLMHAAAVMLQLSEGFEKMFKRNPDPRILRAHLMIEELSELVEAMADKDHQLSLDAIADLCYVVFGTAATLWGDKAGSIVEQAFVEVHNSNMSKATRDPKGDPRLRDKGPDYFPPNTEKVLLAYGIL